jgi:hypothetical protein
MSEDSSRVQMDRRRTLKLVGGSVVGAAATSGTTAAQQTQWGNNDVARTSAGGFTLDTKFDLGAGLNLVNETKTDLNKYQWQFSLSGDGAVLNDDGSFKIPESEYDDSYPRPVAVQQLPEEAKARGSGLVIERTGDISVDVDTGDNDDKYQFPKGQNTSEFEEQATEVVLTAAEIAAANVSATAGAILDGVELAGSLLGLVSDDDSGATYDLREYYASAGGAFLRGGFGFEDLIILADPGDSGTVDVTYEFGPAKTGFTIDAQYDGFGGPILDVTKK